MSRYGLSQKYLPFLYVIIPKSLVFSNAQDLVSSIDSLYVNFIPLLISEASKIKF